MILLLTVFCHFGIVGYVRSNRSARITNGFLSAIHTFDSRFLQLFWHAAVLQIATQPVLLFDNAVVEDDDDFPIR
jgi:hypothetical protein